MCDEHLNRWCDLLFRALTRAILLVLKLCVVAVVLWCAGRLASSDGRHSDDLHALAEQGDTSSISHMTLRKALVDVRQPGSGATPLMCAAGRGQCEVVRLLLARGADVRAATKGTGTALSSAARHGSPTCIRILLENGADPDAGTPDGYTPLMVAAQYGNPAAAEALIAAGASVNGRSRFGVSPLIAAASGGNGDVVRLLLASGADLDVRDREGKDAADVAWKAGSHIVAKLLRGLGHALPSGAGADRPPAFASASRTAHLSAR